MSTFDIAAYLDRLGVADVPVTAGGLAQLQSAQIRRIPFENIEPLLGIEPDLRPEAISDKILRSGRGGYCFELNRLFHGALETLGFRVQRRLARVRNGARESGPRTHLVLICDLDGRRYLADAGFGGPAPLTPLDVEDDGDQRTPNGIYALRTDPVSGERVVRRRTRGQDLALFGFDGAWVAEPDIAAANYLCATWPKSPFSRHLMVNGFDDDTKIGLFDRRMTLDSPHGTERRDLTDAAALEEALCGRLGLRLDRATLHAVWSRIAHRGPAG